MSIHNQPQKKQETHNQARARAVTLRAASPVLLVQLWGHSADAVAATTQERLRKCVGRQGGEKETTISHSPREPIVSSSRRSATARNSAQSLRCPRGRHSEGGILSRARRCIGIGLVHRRAQDVYLSVALSEARTSHMLGPHLINWCSSAAPNLAAA